MIEVTCPKCQTNLEVKEGTPETTCTNCQTILTLAPFMDFNCPSCQVRIELRHGITNAVCGNCEISLVIHYDPGGDLQKTAIIAPKLN
jgi:predicted RNA-binding Zn-ribbon protein involved in translation (DUF1610 family)